MARTEAVPPRALLELNGTELGADVHDAIVDLRVVNGFGVPDYARIEFRVSATGSGLSASEITTKMGDELTISIDDGTASWTIFEGLVVGLGLEVDTGTSQHVVVECYDRLYTLGRKTVATSYQNMTPRDLVEQLVRDAGLTPQVASWPGEQFELRYRYATAYATIDHLVRDAGFEWRVEGDTVIVETRAAKGTHRLTVGENLISFRARFSAAEHVAEVNVTGWDPKNKERIVGRATAADAVSAIGLGVDDVRQAVKGEVALSVPRPVRSQVEADAVAQGILQRRMGEMLRARGEAVPAQGVKPGTLLEVSGLGPTWSGNYYCTNVEYTFGREPLRMFFDVGPSEPESLVDIVGEPVESSLERVLSSLTIGIVTNNNDNTDKLNRVKVKLPYLSDDVETGWARVVQLGSGASRGWNVLPEVGDEVLVGFEHGDIDRPMVIGGLFNGRDKTKLTVDNIVKSGKVHARTFHSRLGHEIHVNDGDSAAEQYIRIKTHDGAAILNLAGDKVELIASGVPVTVRNDQASLEFDKRGNITLKGQKITIRAQQDLILEGTNVTSKATGTSKIEATKIEAKAQALAKVESGGIAALKGSMVQIN